MSVLAKLKIPSWGIIPALFGILAVIAFVLLLLYSLLLHGRIPTIPAPISMFVIGLVACAFFFVMIYGSLCLASADDDDLP